MNELSNESVEFKFLGVVINNPEKLNDTGIHGDLFTRPLHKGAWEAASSLQIVGRSLSPTNMGIESGDPAIEVMVEKFASRPLSTGDYRSMLEHLTDLYCRRRAAKVCKDGHAQCYDEEVSGADVVSSLEGEIMGIRKDGSSGIKMGSNMRDVHAELKWRNENPMKVRGMRFGFPMTERMLDGLNGGSLYIIGARPSVGKTALVTTMMLNMLKEGKVPLVFSLEMKGILLKIRLLASLSGVPLGISKDRPFTDEENRKSLEAIERLEGMKWFYEDSSRLDIEDICSHARRVKQESGFDALFIDYLQIIQNKNFKSNETRLRVGENCFKLKQLADELDVPSIVPAQLRRKEGFFDRSTKQTLIPEPELHDLKESGDVEQDADVVMLLHRDQRENACYTELNVAKNRNGGTGKVVLDFTPHTTSFEEDELTTRSLGKGGPDE